jgi:uncharacterized protein GlcG (DUF336 family)
MMTTHRIPAALASEAVVEAVASCAKQGYFETAVVVDADGVRQAVLRGDRTGSHTLDSAYDKAYTAASFKSDTSALFERSKTVPGLANLFTQLPHLMLFGGGIVIKVGDEVVGAIAVPGAPASTSTTRKAKIRIGSSISVDAAGQAPVRRGSEDQLPG